MHKEPAAGIIRALGGVSAVARATGVTLTSVQRWRWPRSIGGLDGYIPARHYRNLLALAQDQGVELPIAAFVDPAAVPAHERPRRSWKKHAPAVEEAGQ